MFCPKCGNELRESDTFCSNCGNKINEENPVGKERKNVGIVLLIVALVIQVIALISSFSGSTFGNVMAIVLIFSTVFVLVSSVICIIKSKKAEKHKGRTIGIVFTVLSGIVVVIVILGVIFGDNSKSKLDNQMIEVADNAVVILKDRLKNPSSLYLNDITVAFSHSEKSVTLGAENKESDSKFNGTYVVFFDYSAQNGFGGATRSYYQVVYIYMDDDFKLIDASEVEKIPNFTGTVYKVEPNKLKSYSATLK